RLERLRVGSRGDLPGPRPAVPVEVQAVAAVVGGAGDPRLDVVVKVVALEDGERPLRVLQPGSVAGGGGPGSSHPPSLSPAGFGRDGGLMSRWVSSQVRSAARA